MEQMLKIMFSDNPNLPEELYTFCNSIPNYVRAEREYLQIARQVADRLGYDLYNEFEEKLNDYMAQQLDACYLFGLGLRRELAAGLMRLVTGAPGGIDFGYIGQVLLLLGGIYLLSAVFSYLQGFLMAAAVLCDLYRQKRKIAA